MLFLFLAPTQFCWPTQSASSIVPIPNLLLFLSLLHTLSSLLLALERSFIIGPFPSSLSLLALPTSTLWIPPLQHMSQNLREGVPLKETNPFMVKKDLDAKRTIENYHICFNPSIKSKVVSIEKEAQAKTCNTSTQYMDEDPIHWVLDTRFIRSRDAKKIRIVELVRHTKSLIGQFVEEKGLQHHDILKKIDPMDEKFDTLVKFIWVLSWWSFIKMRRSHTTLLPMSSIFFLTNCIIQT